MMTFVRTLLKEDGTNIRYNYRNVQPLNHRRVSKSDVTQGVSQLGEKVENIKEDLGAEIVGMKTTVRSALEGMKTLLSSYSLSRTNK